MYRMLGVDNLSWNIATVQFIFKSFESWKGLSLEQLVNIKLTHIPWALYKAPRDCINLELLLQGRVSKLVCPKAT